jgi:hypothetical protein
MESDGIFSLFFFGYIKKILYSDCIESDTVPIQLFQATAFSFIRLFQRGLQLSSPER